MRIKVENKLLFGQRFYHILIVVGVLQILIGNTLPAWGHLCDDIWRQKDKLIVKPEFQDLVIKDKAQFKIFLKNSMDRAIAEISLEGKSKVFDIEISPSKMQVPNDRKVSFDVRIKLKERVGSGKYPIQFRLVAKGKTFKKFDMDAQVEKQKRTPPSPGPAKRMVRPSPAITTHGIPVLRDVPSPSIDGDMHDSSWKKAAVFTDFKTTEGKRAACQTIVFLTADTNNIYLGFSCQEKHPEHVQEDHIELSIYPPVKEQVCYTVRLDVDGTVRTYRTTTTSVQAVSMGINAKILPPDGRKWWFAEASIPVASFGISSLKKEDTWRINFMRERISARKEISFWSGSSTTFRGRDGCGRIQFLP